MILSVFERLLLLNILPKEGDLTTLKIVRTLRDNLSFSEEEHAALQFKREGNSTLWRDDGEVNKDVAIGEKATDIIADALKALNKAKKLTEQHIDLYEKFVKD